MIWLTIALIISVAINALGAWYIRKLLQSFFLVTDNMDDLLLKIVKFEEHLQTVHSLEMFYGDETLASLMKHTEALIDDLQDYRDAHSLVGEEGMEEEQIDYQN